MSCEISDQQIMEITNGAPRRYDGFRGGPKVGDRFNVIYTLDPTIHTLTVTFDGNNAINKSQVIDFSKGEAKFTSSGYGSFITIQTPITTNVTSRTVLGKDFLSIYSGQIIIQRYQGARWMGMDNSMTRSPSTAISATTQSFDCRHLTSDRFADIYKTVLKKYSN